MIVEIDGQSYDFPDDASEAEIASALGGMAAPPEQEPQSSGGATATVMGARALPAIKQGVARFAANHPAATQKAIGAGISTMAGGAGAAIGGVPGAVVGASIRGVTPAQSVIRATAGQMAGEAPEVARTAGRAVAAANYGKELGLNVKPTGLISTGAPARAFDAYADSQGLKAPRVLDQFGKVVYGPEALPTPKAPSAAGRLMTRGAQTVGKVLGPLSAATGITDFAQTVEPNRQDIGVMGIGASQPTPTPEQTQQIDTRNKQQMDARLQQQDAYYARILAALGIN